MNKKTDLTIYKNDYVLSLEVFNTYDLYKHMLKNKTNFFIKKYIDTKYIYTKNQLKDLKEDIKEYKQDYNK